MEGAVDLLLVSAAKQLKGRSRRRFLAEVCTTLCDGSPRKAEARFGWETLEISLDTKTKVKLGEYSLGGKN